MCNLLSAGLMRLRKAPAFWLCALGTFLVALAHIYQGSQSVAAMGASGYAVGLERVYFELAPYLGAVIAVFVSLFLGTEYAGGAIRNKLVVGFSRRTVYLSHFLTCALAGLCFAGLWLLGGLPGLLWGGGFRLAPAELAGYLLAALALSVSFAAIFTLVGTLCRNRAVTVVLALLLWTALILAASALNDRLSEPEFSGGMAMIDGAFVLTPDTPNPLYLSGPARTAARWLFRLLPTGQAIAMTDAHLEAPALCAALSLLLAGAVTMVGLALFRRKDLK